MKVWGKRWNWRRPLLEREEVYLVSLIFVADKYIPTWEAEIHGDGKFLREIYYKRSLWDVGSATDESHISQEKSQGLGLIWDNFVPKKIVAHSWRLIWDHLPTKMNLSKRVFSHQTQICDAVFLEMRMNRQTIIFSMVISFL